MKRTIDVHTGQVMAGQGEVVLKSDTTGACMVIAAYDGIRKVGAMANAMFLENGLDAKRNFSALTIAAKAIDEMIADMTALGASKDDIEVCLVSGENVHQVEHDHGCDRDIELTIDLLKQRNIRFRDNSLRDAGHNRISLDVQTGDISYVT